VINLSEKLCSLIYQAKWFFNDFSASLVTSGEQTLHHFSIHLLPASTVSRVRNLQMIFVYFP
jgi:hypothetical protein